MSLGKLLKRNGGGDRTRTCISLRTAVFKTAALPLCDPSAGMAVEDYNAGSLLPQPLLRLVGDNLSPSTTHCRVRECRRLQRR